MALELVWTKRAQTGYGRIVKYLEKHFTDKEVREFIKQSTSFFDLLSEYPEILESTKSRKHLHRGPINRFTILTYRVKLPKKQIEIINIRSSRQKPLK